MSSISVLKLLSVAGLAALALAACGRRGGLEPPQTATPNPTRTVPSSAAPAGSRGLPDGIGLGGGRSEPEANAVRAGDELSPAAVPPSGTEAPVETSRGARRGYRIPKEPFILDPLL